jgi:hypothetical protein
MNRAVEEDEKYLFSLYWQLKGGVFAREENYP